MLNSVKAWVEFFMTILRAIFKLKNTTDIQNQQDQQQAQQHLEEHQQHLNNEYNKIDQQNQSNQSKPNPTSQEIADKLNDRF